ncbi:MAG: hypothetical protein RIC19_14995 [Phaeodactylibacter sp.]|uniref:hypothetical protein n=1 Tax=Phaeodactylibacter sp. TaxID=1940289 RepID=UPI0032EB4411
MEPEKPNIEIKSLSDLHRRKELLKLEMKVTRQALGAGFKNTEATIKSNIIRKILIPLGAGGLASMLYNESAGSADKPSWLLFLDQMLSKINEHYTPPSDDGEASEEEQQPPPS